MGVNRSCLYAWYARRSYSTINMVVIPKKIEEWYKPFTKEERLWIALSFIIGIILALTTLLWPLADAKHAVPATAIAIEHEEYEKLVQAFMEEFADKPVPPGTPIYLAGKQYYWEPSKIILKKGVEYEIWVSSTDVMHGFSLVGEDAVYNIMVMPGMAFKFNIRFDKEGTYYIICNEYCGYGHGGMRGIIEVIP